MSEVKAVSKDELKQTVMICSAKGRMKTFSRKKGDDDRSDRIRRRRTDNKGRHKPSWRSADIYRSK